MLDLNDYFYYVHVIEKKGFSNAAKALNIPKSKLSRHISNLEQRLDAQLIQRTSRQFKITEAGETFYNHAKDVIEKVEITESTMQKRRGVLNGRVKISCSIGSAQFAMKNLLIDFIKKHPGVKISQQVTNESIDIISSGIDIAIRGHIAQLPDSSLIQNNLVSIPWHLFASPKYLKNNRKINTPDDLSNQQSLMLGWQKHDGQWTMQKNETQKVISYIPILCSDDMGTLKHAATNGIGIVSLPLYICKNELKSGELVKVLPEWTSDIAQLSILTPSRKGQPLAVQALKEFLMKEFYNYVT